MRVEVLDPELVPRILDEAMGILETNGIRLEHAGAAQMLLDAGAVERGGRILITVPLVERSLRTVPHAISFRGTTDAPEVVVGVGETHFVPGSAALQVWDAATHRPTPPLTDHAIRLARLVEYLPHLSFQSTALVPSDVPEALADRFRLLVALLYCRKPVVTGTFSTDAFAPMRMMLEVVRGGREALASSPLAIFDCCPSAPLSWSSLTTDALLCAARAGIPAELVSMPMAGATGPVTLAGCIVQHCAENLAGVVMHQLASPGAPIIYGGSPGIMDMRYGTTPMGAPETFLINLGNAQVGRSLGLPTHAYMGLSDAAWPDYQAGVESALGALLAALGGIGVVSGAGMLKFENRQSLEKIVLDHEAISIVRRLCRGIEIHERPMASHLMEALIGKGHLLDHPHTRTWLRREHHFPGPAFERRAEPPAEREASGAHGRAREEVERLLAGPAEPVLPAGTCEELVGIMAAEFQRHGASLPPLPGV